MKKLFLFFLVFLLLVPVALSEPPFVSQTNVGTAAAGLQIAYPKFYYFPSGENITLHFHVYNSSNDVMANDTTECYIHIYNKTGNHITQDNLFFDDNGIDFYHTTAHDRYIIGDLYTQIIYCNNSYERGFFSSDFEITKDGSFEEDYDNYSFLIPTIVFLFLAAVAIVGLFVVKKMYLKVVLTLAFELVMLVLLRFNAWYVEITNSNEIVLIHTLNFFYSLGIKAFYFSVAGAMIFLVVLIVNIIRSKPGKQRKKDWTDWGRDDEG